MRVVSVEDFSCELCGGSHVKNIGQIGRFKIVSEGGIAAGVRRIEAITGRAAILDAKKQNELINSLSTLLKVVRAEDLPAQVEKIVAEDKNMRKKLEEVEKIREQAEAQKLLVGVEEIGAFKYLKGVVQAKNPDELRKIADFLIEKLENGVIVLAAVNDGKVSLIVKADKKCGQNRQGNCKISRWRWRRASGYGASWRKKSRRYPENVRRGEKNSLGNLIAKKTVQSD